MGRSGAPSHSNTGGSKRVPSHQTLTAHVNRRHTCCQSIRRCRAGSNSSALGRIVAAESTSRRQHQLHVNSRGHGTAGQGFSASRGKDCFLLNEVTTREALHKLCCFFSVAVPQGVVLNVAHVLFLRGKGACNCNLYMYTTTRGVALIYCLWTWRRFGMPPFRKPPFHISGVEDRNQTSTDRLRGWSPYNHASSGTHPCKISVTCLIPTNLRLSSQRNAHT
jgi:hypothetical protein